LKQHFRTGDQALVREINLSIVFNQLWTNAPLSRAQLANVTGLNKTTISSLVHELLTKGFVREAGQRSSRGGRPATLLELNPRAGCMIGVEMGVDFISAILTSFRAEIEWRHYESIETGQDYQATIERTRGIIQDATQMAGRLGLPLLGIGVGVPGLIDVDAGLVLFAPNLEWRNVPVRDLLAESLPLPILVDNDANLSALGEYYFGAARGVGTFLHIAIGVGLGGGVFLDGQPYRGASGFAGEFGHMLVQDGGPPCKCGNAGCWETVVSNLAVVKQAQAAVETHPHSRILELAHGQTDRITLPVVMKAAEEGDETALEVLRQTGYYLGVGIANLINAFNPELIVLGGGLSQAYPFLLPVAEEVVAAKVIARAAKSTQIVASAYGQDACVLGAVGSVLHEILTTPNFSLAVKEKSAIKEWKVTKSPIAPRVSRRRN
jgi:glucokinase-like ROK family protein